MHIKSMYCSVGTFGIDCTFYVELSIEDMQLLSSGAEVTFVKWCVELVCQRSKVLEIFGSRSCVVGKWYLGAGMIVVEVVGC